MGETAKQKAWKHFDRIVNEAVHSTAYKSSPWNADERYEPDFRVLEHLLGVPLALNASSQSGVPALALDVWVAYELRRAGFAPDAVWPRAHHPRVMPTPVVNYAELAQKSIRDKIVQQLTKPTPLKGVVATDARILGRHYVKQVDVVMSAWETGPEILISTKRMDSSFGKNAANRIEEAYGDAKNLRARHPLAAHGFLYGLRSTILDSEPDKARWLIDLLAKLAHEGDAYNAVCLLMLDYDGTAPEGSDGGHDDDEDAAAVGLSTEFPLERLSGASVAEDEAKAENSESSESSIALPKVSILAHPEIPEELTAGSFLKRIVELVLRSTPITMHPQARRARGWPTAGLAVDETDV